MTSVELRHRLQPAWWGFFLFPQADGPIYQPPFKRIRKDWCTTPRYMNCPCSRRRLLCMHWVPLTWKLDPMILLSFPYQSHSKSELPFVHPDQASWGSKKQNIVSSDADYLGLRTVWAMTSDVPQWLPNQDLSTVSRNLYPWGTLGHRNSCFSFQSSAESCNQVERSTSSLVILEFIETSTKTYKSSYIQGPTRFRNVGSWG